jgi:hypothetical protein
MARSRYQSPAEGASEWVVTNTQTLDMTYFKRQMWFGVKGIYTP